MKKSDLLAILLAPFWFAAIVIMAVGMGVGEMVMYEKKRKWYAEKHGVQI